MLNLNSIRVVLKEYLRKLFNSEGRICRLGDKLCYISCFESDRKIKEFKQLTKMLNARGYKISVAPSLDLPKGYYEIVGENIKNSDIFIFLVTENSSATCMLSELEIAWKVREMRGAIDMINNVSVKPHIYGIVTKGQQMSNYARDVFRDKKGIIIKIDEVEKIM